MLLAPTVNLHRTPIGGRNFECMSEDPYLTARTAVAYVRGLQSEGVAACIKHFIGNDTEFERNSIDSRIDERTLRELYLVPFEAAVKEAGVMSVMTSYNRINGPWAADSVDMIDERAARRVGLRRAGDERLVRPALHRRRSDRRMSTWRCPGPTLHRGKQAARRSRRRQGAPPPMYVAAAHNVLVGDASARCVRRRPPGARADPRRARRSGAGSPGWSRRHGVAATIESLRAMRAVLPLRAGDLRRVAVIGPNAARGQTEGGGSAHVHATHVSHPLDALSNRLGRLGVEVTHAVGCLDPQTAAAHCRRRCHAVRRRPVSETVDGVDDPDAHCRRCR